MSGMVERSPAAARAARPVAIRIDNVTQTYNRRGRNALQALDRVSLDVAQGEFVCLLGASGCGKTTLLSLIVGLYGLTAGSSDVGGRGGGRLFLGAGPFPWLTAQGKAG